MKPDEEIVANAVRMEHDTDSGEVYLVFKISSEQFKKKILESWADDVELKVVGKKLKRA